jgi:5-methylcytosine-specific restriction enzyme A
MTLEPAMFLALLQAQPDRLWETPHQRKRFWAQVLSPSTILVTPQDGAPRPVTMRDVRTFCDLYNAGVRKASAMHHKLFHTSYFFTWLAALQEAPALPDYEAADVEVPSLVTYPEGRVRTAVINVYERSRAARAACTATHSTNCGICGFSFGAAYGAEAAGFIHVHHLNPVALQDATYELDAVRDLLPVCPNCHAVIHLGGGCRTPDEVRAMLERARASASMPTR